MDIMRPKLQRIGNMCFRRLDIPDDGVVDDLTELSYGPKVRPKANISSFGDNVQEIKQSVPSKLSIDALEANEDLKTSEEIIDNKYDIKDISDGKGVRFKAEMKIAKYFHKFIIGQNGSKKNEIENMSRTRIFVPTVNDLTSSVVISGNNENDILYAINRINGIIEYSRNKSDFTHFLSIPFNQKPIRDQFANFKTEVLKLYQSKSAVIDKSLFQDSRKLHLTISPLLLTDQNERRIAAEILTDSHNRFIKPLTNGNPIKVKLEGIDYMNDDPTQVNVLYAKVTDISDKPYLIQITNHLLDRFQESGLMVRNKEFSTESKVKIHVTLMNTTFLQTEESVNRGRGRRYSPRQSFDASPILEKLKDYCFGEITVDTIEISIRHTSRGKDGYYSHSHRIELLSEL